MPPLAKQMLMVKFDAQAALEIHLEQEMIFELSACEPQASKFGYAWKSVVRLCGFPLSDLSRTLLELYRRAPTARGTSRCPMLSLLLSTICKIIGIQIACLLVKTLTDRGLGCISHIALEKIHTFEDILQGLSQLPAFA